MRPLSALLCLLPMLLQSLRAAQPAVDDDFALQGEYKAAGLGLQVVVVGDHKFMAVRHAGGLPGEGGERASRKTVEAALQDGAVTFAWPGGETTVLRAGAATHTADGKNATLEKVERKSPSLGAKPPEGAVILFDGTSADAFAPGRLEDGLLCEGANSKQKFQSQTLHLEFRLPYLPKARGQGRGNSGCYLQGRYETQVLDSFGLEGRNNECGGIYSIKDPDLNMCLPPMAWQTYDIDFTAAKFDAEGKKTANARMTVRLNGVVVHNDVELPKITTAAPTPEGPGPGFLHLQNHGNPVRYRNIWVVEKP